MKQWLKETVHALQQGKDLSLAIVVARSGSSPGKEGAVMAVCGEEQWGTVGGGTLEATASLVARHVDQPLCQSFDMSNEDAAGLGMICGGSATVQILPLHTAHLQPMSSALELMQRGKPAALAFACSNDGVLVKCLGEDVSFTYTDHENGSITLVPLQGEGIVRIFGGGHVAQALAPAITAVEFPYIIYEDREEFVTEERFPHAVERICGDYDIWSDEIKVSPQDYIVIMTRGHQGDYTVLRQALKTDAAYIGVIGSRRKMEVTRQRLLEEGFTETDLARIFSPIGLNIGAQTPAEIAVSITAELIQERSKRK